MTIRLTLTALATASLLSAPASAQVIENEQIAVYAQQWVQAKAPEHNGLLSFLNAERGQKGEYFSIRCQTSGGAEVRSIRLGYPRALPGGDATAVELKIDGQSRTVPARFTGTTNDAAYTKSDIYGYELTFSDTAAQTDFLRAMQAGNTLLVGGQSLPVSLTGFTAALKGQASYCR